MTVLAFQNNVGVVHLSPGGLADLWSDATDAGTVWIVFNRDATNTDSTQWLVTFDAGITIDLHNTEGPRAIFNGFRVAEFGFSVSDDTWYGLCVKMTLAGGTGTLKANMYNFSTDTWTGWANGVAGENLPVENTGSDHTDIQLGGASFTFVGRMALVAGWLSELADATVTHATNGLHVSTANVVALSPNGMVRPGETFPGIEDDTGGSMDETSSSDVATDAGADLDYSLSLTPAADPHRLAVRVAPSFAVHRRANY